MEIKEINEVLEQAIADLANKDEMEAEDGMNIVEDIDSENEIAEKKAKKAKYLKVVDACEELMEFLEEDINPATGLLDEDTDAFYQLLQQVVNETHSRSLAFD